MSEGERESDGRCSSDGGHYIDREERERAKVRFEGEKHWLLLLLPSTSLVAEAEGRSRKREAWTEGGKLSGGSSSRMSWTRLEDHVMKEAGERKAEQSEGESWSWRSNVSVSVSGRDSEREKGRNL